MTDKFYKNSYQMQAEEDYNYLMKLYDRSDSFKLRVDKMCSHLEKIQIEKINKIIPLESQEAKTFVAWSKYHPIARDCLIHIANERKTSLVAGKRLKDSGVRKGTSDYFLAYPHEGKGGLWIELKRSDRNISRLTKEQEAWLAQCIRVGYSATVAYGADEAIRAVEDYLK